MSRCAPIQMDVTLGDPSNEFYCIDALINAPLLNWEPAPMKRGFLGTQRRPDPPATFVERRIVVRFSFMFTLGYVHRELSNPPAFEGLYDNLFKVNADITPDIDLAALSPFELVDAYAWDGRRPPTLTYLNRPAAGQVLATAPALWDVASVNQVTGERVLALRSHCSKDDAFKVLNRMNALVEYSHAVASAFQNTFKEGDDFQQQVHNWCIANPPRFLPRG